jgi:hypothetical protein|tara:strand:- start:31 stop:201 length:171 start_codon:yes stop_codon:yes gene_type:complete
MKYIPLGIIIVLLISVYNSVKISDKYAVIANKISHEKVTEIRHYVFSGKKHSTTAH